MLDMYGLPIGIGAALLLSGAGLCLMGYRRHLRQVALKRVSTHSQWPLTARELVTLDEHHVWQWLREAFADHHVMLKVPLVRYTAPLKQAESRVWHKRLSGVYCTFTVCGSDGTVIGCMDVGELDAATRAHCSLKESVLEQCGIPYAMVLSGKLPTAQEIRSAFIGQIELTEINPSKPAFTDTLAPVREVCLELPQAFLPDPAALAAT